MLRITVFKDANTTRLKFEGKLAHEWVIEARNAWSDLLEMNGHTGIVVDLMDVSFVDDAGHELLVEMHRADAELIGAGPLISALIDEIEDGEAAAAQRHPDRD